MKSDKMKQKALEEIGSYTEWAWAGGAAVLANFVVLLVFGSNSQLRKKYVMQIALALGDLINGISFVYGSVDRISEIHAGSYYTRHTAWRCCQKPWVPLATLGSHVPTIVTLVMACEKFVAVFKPLYYKNVHFKDKIKLIIFSYSICFLLLLSQYLGAYFDESHAVSSKSGMCSLSKVGTTWFTQINYLTVVCGNLIAFGLTCMAYLKVQKISKAAKSQTSRNENKSESQNINALLFVSFFSVFMIVLPNGLLLVGKSGIKELAQLKKDFTRFIGVGMRTIFTLFPINSVVNVFVYFVFFNQFREQAIKIASCGKAKDVRINTVSVHPMTTKSPFGGGTLITSRRQVPEPLNITTF